VVHRAGTCNVADNDESNRSTFFALTSPSQVIRLVPCFHAAEGQVTVAQPANHFGLL